jgi:hypothetical protein
MGFGHMVDVMATLKPWTNVDEYIEIMKNNNDAPCQWTYGNLIHGKRRRSQIS